MNASELVRAFEKIVMAEAGISVAWEQNSKPLTGEQLERIQRRAGYLFCCQHRSLIYVAERNALDCQECGQHLPAENPEDSAFAAQEAERKP